MRRARGADLPLGVLALAGAAVGAVSTISFFRVALLPSIGDSLSLSASDLGLVTMTFGVGRLLADVPAGRLADRVPPSVSFALGGLAAGLASFGLAAAGGRGALYAAALALGVGSSISNTTGMTVFSTSVPRARRGTALAIYSACLLGGQSIGPAIGGGLTALGSWRTAEVVAGVAALVVAVAVALAPAGRRRAVRPDEHAPPHHAAAGLADRAVLYGVSFAIFFVLGAMPQTLVPIIGDSAFHLGAPAIGLALGIGGICRFGGSLAGGIVSDRISRKTALVPGLALMGVGVALFAADAGVWVWVAGILVTSVSSYGISVAAAMLADRSRAGSVGRRLGGFRFVGDLGVIAGPAVAGALYAHAGRAAAVLTVAALPALLAAAAALVLTEAPHSAPVVVDA